MRRPALFLIDSFGFIFRAYHARARSGAPSMRTRAGLSTEAVYIFHNMVRRLLSQYSPEYIAAIFESEAPTLREQEFAGYKANRPRMPPELAEQIPYVRRMLEAMRIPVLDHPGYEADDVIGTLAKQSSGSAVSTVIVSSDKDMLQLVDDRVLMLDPRKDDLLYDTAQVKSFLGVAPAQVIDLLALKGDAVDNIPGAPGIGDKGARDLIAKYGSVEGAMEHAAEIKRKSYRESLQNNQEQIRLSKRLATIETAVPVEWDLAELAAKQPDPEALKEIYGQLEFFSLLKSIGGSGGDAGARPKRHYKALETGTEVCDYLREIAGSPRVGVAISAEGEGALQQISIGLAGKVGEGRSVAGGLVAEVKDFLVDKERPKAVLDLKTTLRRTRDLGLAVNGVRDDPLLYEFLLTADPAGAVAGKIINRRLGVKMDGGVEQLADLTLELAGMLADEVEERGLRKVYETIDLPLIPVLERMEATGVRIERNALAKLSRRMETEIGSLTEKIHEIAGHPFNLNSPSQLAKVLFEDLKLPAPPRSGKKRGFSTAAGVLDGLAPEYPIAALVLEYRQLVKLKGTYVDALPELISPVTGRLHTSFNPAGAATGRLSSSNPNLQNIPIRTEMGREIRAAIVPEPGWKLIVADYSQIELRLLAHMSGDPVLVQAFRSGEDIHTRTAAEVFGVPPIAVTKDLRRNAKAVNFGIIYGLSAFGLANQLGIPRADADRYIKSYFERYRGVRKFIDATIALVKKTGVTKTMFGRERPIPDMNSRNPSARGFAERTAVNTPLQGTAADLIKLAMIRIDERFAREKIKARMLLQVHDELVFEAPEDEVERVGEMARREMESVRRLDVPLVVDVGIGDNWRDAK